MGDSAELGRKLATRAMSLARSGVSADQAVGVLLDQATGDETALRLAHARCGAAVDQDPGDQPAAAAHAFLAEAIRRAGAGPDS